MRFAILAGTALAAAALFAGCSDSSSSNDEAATPAPAATTAATPTTAPTRASSSTPAASPSTAPTAAATAATTAPAKVSANNATRAELQAAFTAAGITGAAQWAREVEEYRPYPTNDPNMAKLRQELAKYNPGSGVVDKIVATLALP